jgi:hypothetical protein
MKLLRTKVTFLERVIFIDSARPVGLRIAVTNLLWGVMWCLADDRTISGLTGRAMTPDHTPGWVSGTVFILIGLSYLWLLYRGNPLRVLNVFISLFFWTELAIRAGLLPLLQTGIIVPVSLLMLLVALDSAWVFWRLAGDISKYSRFQGERGPDE